MSSRDRSKAWSEPGVVLPQLLEGSPGAGRDAPGTVHIFGELGGQLRLNSWILN